MCLLRSSLLLCLSSLLSAALSYAADEFKPGAPWPDDKGIPINAHGGGVMFHEGTYYWFGEHKVAGPPGNVAQVGVACYSSTGLYDWKNEGIVLAVDEDPKSEIAKGCIIERPKVIFNPQTRKFVMWFHLEHLNQGYNTARAAVAIADRPAGPYRFIASHRPNQGTLPQGFDDKSAKDPHVATLKRDQAKGQMSRDMTLFIDDDARAYQIAASEENQTLHISLLTPDYQGFTGKFFRILPGGLNEAPAICKHGGRYWLIASGCTGWSPNEARSFVADRLEGPWTPLGNPCSGPHPEPGGMGPEKTWGAQSTFILPVHDRPGTFIALFDVWRPENPIDGRYLWLPVRFEDDHITVTYPQAWRIPGR